MGALHPERNVGLQLAGARGAVALRTGSLPGHSLIRREPAADDTLAREKLVPTARALAPADLPTRRHRPAHRPVLAARRRTGVRPVVELQHRREGESSATPTASSPSTSSNRLTTTASPCGCGSASRTGRMLGHFRHEVGHYYQNVLVETGSGAAQIPRRMPHAVRRRTRQLQRRHRPALQVRRSRRLGGDVHLRVRHHASVGGLRRVLRPLPAHRRHHRHQPRGGHGVEGRPGSVLGAAGHRSAGVLRRRAD